MHDPGSSTQNKLRQFLKLCQNVSPSLYLQRHDKQMDLYVCSTITTAPVFPLTPNFHLLAAFNENDIVTCMDRSNFAPGFRKLLGPQSMNANPQTYDEWLEDLKTGFVGQNYKTWNLRVLHYWEDVLDRSAIVWCCEKGTLVDDEGYEMDYVMRYEFDEQGRYLVIHENTDSALQQRIFSKWMDRLEKAKEKQ